MTTDEERRRRRESNPEWQESRRRREAARRAGTGSRGFPGGVGGRAWNRLMSRNQRLEAAEALGIDTSQRGWESQLPQGITRPGELERRRELQAQGRGGYYGTAQAPLPSRQTLPGELFHKKVWDPALGRYITREEFPIEQYEETEMPEAATPEQVGAEVTPEQDLITAQEAQEAAEPGIFTKERFDAKLDPIVEATVPWVKDVGAFVRGELDEEQKKEFAKQIAIDAGLVVASAGIGKAISV